ncbi:hypothetical protein HGI30_13080 [Paenibacillus albicereus]|uniref:Outer membrane lipoprotein carrier protein LolA n=1 Tax=Paenibacillus albicereus TaxID=2726185 RepID=A0A6H2GYD4_9BACL|nr:hypothetical protein [Paenibacillus albicereus]QJC52402.1 hypothetical protein HGI30_13080 [Paenibacillus albicereus]
MSLLVLRKFAQALLVLLATAALLAACAGASAERSPRELLRLAVSGLSAPESYRFALTETGSPRQENWTGEVRRHDGLRLLGAADGAPARTGDGIRIGGEDSYNPSALLEGLLDQAASVRLDEARSDGDEAVLMIEPDASRAAALWSKRLSAEGKRLSPGRPLQAAGMSYELIVDRHRLVPVELTERSRLLFSAGEGRSEEERTLRFRFDTKP